MDIEVKKLAGFQSAEAFHFVMFSCFHCLPLLKAPEPKDALESLLEATRAGLQARTYAYVLMPEHVHLLMNVPAGILVGVVSEGPQSDDVPRLGGDGERFGRLASSMGTFAERRPALK